MVYIYAGKEARKPVQDIGLKKSIYIFSPYDSEENVKHSISFLLQKKRLEFFLQTLSDVKNTPQLSTQVRSTFQPLGHVSLI